MAILQCHPRIRSTDNSSAHLFIQFLAVPVLWCYSKNCAVNGSKHKSPTICSSFGLQNCRTYTRAAVYQVSNLCYTTIAQMIQQKNIGCRWYSSVFSLWQPTGHWFSCQMGVCHWSPSVAKTDEDQRQPMFFCNIIWAMMYPNPRSTQCMRES